MMVATNAVFLLDLGGSEDQTGEQIGEQNACFDLFSIG